MKSTSTTILEITPTASEIPMDIFEIRISSPSLDSTPTLVPTPHTEEFKTPASHRESIPSRQNLEDEFDQLRHFDEQVTDELTQVAEEQNASQDDLDDEDADTESLYEPTRAITPPLPRKNPERTRRKPQRYGQLEVNYITADNSNNKKIAKKRVWSPGIKLWQLSLLLIFGIIIPFGQTSSNKSIEKMNITTKGEQANWPELISMITMGWKSVSPWIEYIFSLITGMLLAFSFIMLLLGGEPLLAVTKFLKCKND